MFGLQRIVSRRWPFSRNVSNIKILTQQQSDGSKRRSGRRDVFCEHIQSLCLPIDWGEVRRKYFKTSDRALELAFEIKCMNAVITCEPRVSEEVERSLLQHMDPLIDKLGRNVIFDLHVAAVAARANPIPYVDLIKRVLVDTVSNHKHLVKFRAFSEALTGLASTSKENCELALQLSGESGVASNWLSHHCLKHGMHDAALTFPVDAVNFESELEMWIDSLNKFGTNDSVFRKFLSRVHDAAVSVHPSSRPALENVLQKLGYRIVATELDDSSRCVECKTQMSGISDEEHQKCINICQQRVLTKNSNVFMNSEPREVASFLQMIDRKLRSGLYYDVVIDALNVSYLTQATVFRATAVPHPTGRQVQAIRSYPMLVKNLEKVLTNCKSLFPRILLIGRNHMHRWPGLTHMLRAKKESVDTLFLHNESEDDPFIIYAAIQTRNTYVISNDFFRDHKFSMDDVLFDRWLRSRLVRVPHDARSFSLPPKHEIKVNFSDNWRRLHFPIGYNSTSFTTWICCHK